MLPSDVWRNANRIPQWRSHGKHLVYFLGRATDIIKIRSNNCNLRSKVLVTPIQRLDLCYYIRFGWSRSRYSDEGNTVTSLTHRGAIHIFRITALDYSLDNNLVYHQITTGTYKRMSLFNASAAHTTGSHVKVYNAPHLGSVFSNTMAEFLKVERRTKQARLFFLPRRRAFSF